MRIQIITLLFLSILTTTYFGCSSDSDSDECETITCVNEGTFVDCECVCPQGYTGSDCSTQVTPSKVIISKATVKVFPLEKSDGSSWDGWIIDPEEQLPDIFLTFSNDGNILYESDFYYENALGGANFYEFQPNLELTNFQATYYVGIWDYDGTAGSELMTLYGFDVYTGSNVFPQTLQVISQENTIRVDLELSYQW